DAGLGNGGLGRLAACFLDSMATLNLPAKGYGIRYEYGIFNQVIENGNQIEQPDYWLYRGNPWETPRIDRMQTVKFYGRTHHRMDDTGKLRVAWLDTDNVQAVPYETPIPGYRTDTVNLLTLWSARATDEFNLEYFNHGDYLRAVEQKAGSETISKVLYPNDTIIEGMELRLKQEYFFVAASLQEIMHDFLQRFDNLMQFPDKVAIQLNDTHPCIAIAELMRLLVDVHGLEWDPAWKLTTRTFAYTNHTLLSEALETWDLALLQRVLPRHMEIIFEINRRFLQMIEKRFPDDTHRRGRMSIIDEQGGRQVRMAHLAVVGSHSVNGVAKLHTRLLRQSLFRDFYEIWPQKFNNKTNGITQRRWLKLANPALAKLITETIGPAWETDLDALEALSEYVDDGAFQSSWSSVKDLNKMVFATYVNELMGLTVDPASMFDMQVKRIHEYKRQLLNIFGVIARYFRIRDNRAENFVPRTVILGGKAAPGYFMAKLIIKLANDVADVVNNDPASRDLLKVIFVPNYGVSLAERIFPASDLSQQISTAGKEASGTSNMKFALNGALTIGTLDGANIEIRDAVGADNMFIFGLSAAEVHEKLERGYNPGEYYNANEELRRVIEALASGLFSNGDRNRFKPVVDALMHHGDHYLVLADFKAYLDCQERVDDCYRHQQQWVEKSIKNVAGMGYFSSDRTIREYAADIWGVAPAQQPRSTSE
ncbi:MAG: glycogen/starch/alpha-glucan phosphorylase, partial [Deltaproteobacteria bacterium]|nr:glycogen/starch/alpha-glucan phosphorylase [Deltaproteobacteria bacterium]